MRFGPETSATAFAGNVHYRPTRDAIKCSCRKRWSNTYPFTMNRLSLHILLQTLALSIIVSQPALFASIFAKMLFRYPVT